MISDLTVGFSCLTSGEDSCNIIRYVTVTQLTFSVSYYRLCLWWCFSQVQDDLTQLRKRLARIDQDKALDVQALDAAIRRTEEAIKVPETLEPKPQSTIITLYLLLGSVSGLVN